MSAFWWTMFPDLSGNSMQTGMIELDTLGKLILATHAAEKEKLPMLKLARFGFARSPKGSLRHDDNLLTVSGIEADYDGNTVPIDEAIKRLQAEDVAFIAYTTPSYTVAEPRWRLLLPFSKERPKGERTRMMNRLNGLLGGILARESWTLSQSFFFGHVDGAAVDIDVCVWGSERFIDDADNLDAGAMIFRAPAAGPAPGGGAPPIDFDALDEVALLGLIQSGEHLFRPAARLIWMWAKAGLNEQTVEANLTAAFDAIPLASRPKKWAHYRARIPAWIKTGFAKAKKKRAYLRALMDYLLAPPWQGMIRFNTFTQQIEVVSNIPPQPGQQAAGWRPLSDPEDILAVQMHLHENGFEQVGKNAVRDALLLVSRALLFHPVTSWLESLPPWDGQERMEKLFIDYFPAEIPEVPSLADTGQVEPRDEIVKYLEETASCFLIGAVARVFEPGCKTDCLPVLVGAQGWHKSRSVRALVPETSWFSDDVSANLIDRDTKESLSGKWILELAEFPHIKREVEKVKGFFSRQIDRFRRAYGAASEDRARQCAFVATTNELEFVDTTGNRRFWPILLKAPADIEKIERDRDQLWAEALHWYRSGTAKWWLTPTLEAIARQVQETFLEEDTWDGMIFAWLKGRTETTLVEVLTDCLSFVLRPSDSTWGQAVARKREQARAATTLKRLGWHRNHRRLQAGARDWIWCPNAK